MENERYVKKCCDCGAEFEGTAKMRFCSDCRHAHILKSARKSRAKIKEALSYRKGTRKRRTKIQKTDITQCRKCIYKLYLTDGAGNNIACGYLYFTNHMRPSEPSPNCTAFSPYDKSERKRMIQNLK